MTKTTVAPQPQLAEPVAIVMPQSKLNPAGKNFNIHAWVPEDAKFVYDLCLKNNLPIIYCTLSYEEIADMLQRLFASLNMKPVWEGVRSKNMTETVYKLPNGFAMAAIAAYSPSPFTEMTPNVLKKWRQDVQGASERLVQLLAVSPLEHFFDNKLFKLCQAHKAEIGTAASKEFFSVLCDTSDFSELRERFSPEQLTVAWSEFDRNNAEAIRVEKYFSSIGKFSDLLQELSRDIQTMEITPTFRPNGAEARRTHFVRCLTNYFINKYGTPKREWVAITTAAAFDDEAITARQVARLAPVPDTKKKKTAA